VVAHGRRERVVHRHVFHDPLRVFRELHGAPVNVTPTGAAGREDAFSASYRSEWAHFLAIVRGAVRRPDLADQVMLHRTLEGAYESAGRGRDVTL